MKITVDIEELKNYQYRCHQWIAKFILWAPDEFFNEGKRLNALSETNSKSTNYDSTHKVEAVIDLISYSSEAGKKWFQENPVPRIVPSV